MPRIRYSDAVRAQAVRLVLESQKPLTQVAGKFGCSVSALQNWLKAHRQGAKTSQPGVKKFQQAVADSNCTSNHVPVSRVGAGRPTCLFLENDDERQF